MKALLPAALAALLIACSAPGGEPPAARSEQALAADLARLNALHEEIEALAGEARCSAQHHCRALAFGAKSCGGPLGYIIYSLAETNPAQLKAKVRAHKKLNLALNRQLLLTSDCAYEMEPKPLACHQQRCTGPEGSLQLYEPASIKQPWMTEEFAPDQFRELAD